MQCVPWPKKNLEDEYSMALSYHVLARCILPTSRAGVRTLGPFSTLCLNNNEAQCEVCCVFSVVPFPIFGGKREKVLWRKGRVGAERERREKDRREREAKRQRKKTIPLPTFFPLLPSLFSYFIFLFLWPKEEKNQCTLPPHMSLLMQDMLAGTWLLINK